MDGKIKLEAKPSALSMVGDPDQSSRIDVHRFGLLCPSPSPSVRQLSIQTYGLLDGPSSSGYCWRKTWGFASVKMYVPSY